MSFLSRVITLFGLVLLAHAYVLTSNKPEISLLLDSFGIANNVNYRGYSAHEHTVLFSNANIAAIAALPNDIIIETLAAVLVVSIGLVLGAEKLKPISWRDWAGEIERDGGARNPYMGLEERFGFWDIRVSNSKSHPT